MIGLDREDYKKTLFYAGDDRKLKKQKRDAWDEVYNQNDVETFKQNYDEVTEKVLLPALNRIKKLITRR